MLRKKIRKDTWKIVIMDLQGPRIKNSWTVSTRCCDSFFLDNCFFLREREYWLEIFLTLGINRYLSVRVGSMNKLVVQFYSIRSRNNANNAWIISKIHNLNHTFLLLYNIPASDLEIAKQTGTSIRSMLLRSISTSFFLCVKRRVLLNEAAIEWQ